MRVRFLIDENLSPRLKTALWRMDSRVDILRIGDEGAPAFHTLDPEIIEYLVTEKRLLVTDDRGSIPEHLHEHYQQGGASHWGVIWVRPRTSLGLTAENLYLVWEASEAEEWVDRSEWIPF